MCVQSIETMKAAAKGLHVIPAFIPATLHAAAAAATYTSYRHMPRLNVFVYVYACKCVFVLDESWHGAYVYYT